MKIVQLKCWCVNISSSNVTSNSNEATSVRMNRNESMLRCVISSFKMHRRTQSHRSLGDAQCDITTYTYANYKYNIIIDISIQGIVKNTVTGGDNGLKGRGREVTRSTLGSRLRLPIFSTLCLVSSYSQRWSATHGRDTSARPNPKLKLLKGLLNQMILTCCSFVTEKNKTLVGH